MDDTNGNSKAKAALPKTHCSSIDAPESGEKAAAETANHDAITRCASSDDFPYLSSVYDFFIGCYFKSYQRNEKNDKPYEWTIVSSAAKALARTAELCLAGAFESMTGRSRARSL